MTIKKGIILAGGLGSRLYPLTKASNKQLLPIFDKPTIYYPLSTLMLMGIQDILFISRAEDLKVLENLFGDGKSLGVSFSYRVQDEPRGLADAFIVGEDFINNDSVAMILGDNFFHGHGLSSFLQSKTENHKGAHLFTYRVEDPSAYGVVTTDTDGRIIKIDEKPTNPESNLAITGLYLFDGSVSGRAKKIKPSKRGELEITDLIKSYDAEIEMAQLGRGYVWLDVGQPKSLLDASNYVEVIQSRQGILVASPEEIALRMEYIARKQFDSIVKKMPKSPYQKKLFKI